MSKNHLTLSFIFFVFYIVQWGSLFE